MGEFNSDDHYVYYCGQESLRRNGVDIMVNKRVQNAVLGYYPLTEWPRIPGKMSRKLAAKTKNTRITMSSGTLRPAACRG